MLSENFCRTFREIVGNEVEVEISIRGVRCGKLIPEVQISTYMRARYPCKNPYMIIRGKMCSILRRYNT